MKKQLSLWDGVQKPASSCSSPLNGWVSEDSVCHLSSGDRGDLSHLFHQALTQDSREREVSSAALETVKIKEKLKRRRMSEGLIASERGLADSSIPPGIFLKPVLCRSGSQRLQRAFRPVPPIQNGLPSSEPSRMINGEQEHGENGTGCVGSDGNNKEWMSEGEGYKAFLPPLYCSNGDGKKSLGAALIPPIPKSAPPTDEDPGRAAVPLPSSQHLVFQEDLEMRPRSGSRSEEKTLKPLELQPLEPVLPALRVTGGVKSAGHFREHVPPLTGLPLSQAKQMDHPVNPRLLSDDDLKDSNGRIHVMLSKSAQKKIHQKRMREMELLRREREKERESLQLPRLSVDPGDAAEESSGPLPVNGAVSISPGTSRERAPAASGKRTNRPSLPSIPVISQDGNFPRKPSANSLPAIALDTLDGGEEPESGDAQEARPFPCPQQALLSALAGLSSDDWQQKAEGLLSIRRLAICHSEVLLCRLHDVSLAVTKEVNNLRSKVSRCAIGTLGELFKTTKKHMDHEVDDVTRTLLQKMGDSNEFIQKGTDQSLGIMVGSVTPTRAMMALMASGVPHRNVLVRRCAAKHLLTAMELIGAEKLLSGVPYSTDLLVRTVVKLAQDCHQDTRCYGRKMLNMLMNHQKFKKYLKQSAPSHDLLDVMATIQQKETEEHKCEAPPAKDRRKSKNSGLTKAQDNLPHDGGVKSGCDVLILPRQSVRRTSLQTAEETEQLTELYKLLTAKDFRTQIEGVMLLLDYCKNRPQLISTNIVQIFDIFILRLQDCNKKVNQQALEVLASMIPILGGALHPVLVSLVAAVTENLNSKHLGIHSAAMKVLEASTAHLDNALLLQTLAQRVRFLSGQALLIVTEHLSVLVTSVYPRKPLTVKRYILPTLWFFLENRILPVRSSNVRAVVSKLANSLYQVMGSRLKEYAASQPQSVAKNFLDIFDPT
ncbi:TOG array regulator of axonemal microtubules protein 2-like [Numenius arquata]|uniref:TOG array regulator of axonemal microtubules protein 2-like n=1 Tax=Numenius arquata TaxID=31919 RepID=UPI003D3062B2